jgi:Flp pilus assembly pilin Flp
LTTIDYLTPLLTADRPHLGRAADPKEIRQRPRRVDRAGGVKARPGSLIADERGGVTVEYTVLLVLVALSGAVAMMTLGAPLLRMLWTYQTWLLLPFP